MPKRKWSHKLKCNVQLESILTNISPPKTEVLMSRNAEEPRSTECTQLGDYQSSQIYTLEKDGRHHKAQTTTAKDKEIDETKGQL